MTAISSAGNPETGANQTLLEGATDDFTGIYSRDGTKLAFLRRDRARVGAEPELISIHVANADGTNELDLTGPLDAPDQWDWSPAGDAIALTSKIDGRYTLQVVPTDGSDRLRVLDTGTEVTWPFWLPPNGDEIMFRGVAEDARRPAQRPVRGLCGRRRAAAADGDRRPPRRRLRESDSHPPTARTCCTGCGIPSP